jgi:hypothetical protein
VDPAVGPTSDISGVYKSSSVNDSAGGTYSVVGSQGDVFVLWVTPAAVTSGTGTVNAATNSFVVQTAANVTVNAAINTTTNTVTGTVTTTGASAGTVSFAGTGSAVASSTVLTNMSARGQVTPALPLIVGFVVDGPLPKTVVLRGVGPGLVPFGVSNTLAHLQLSLYDASSTLLGVNAGWGGGADLAADFAQVGAFALPPASTDAALVITLAPGAYSVVISDGAYDSGGNVMAEIYDQSIDPSEVSQKLVNVSTRGQVMAGMPLIGGFVVVGNSPKKVLVRGIGPSLAAYGVTGALADPVLAIYNAAGTVVAMNDDWGTPQAAMTGQTPATAATLSAAAAEVGAFALTLGSKDSTLIVIFAPGTYSGVVSGANGASGNALVEVYELPAQ